MELILRCTGYVICLSLVALVLAVVDFINADWKLNDELGEVGKVGAAG